ncbi:MAG: hypothetical protein AVDCRST_MAG96-3189 [uncultured Segetibacter sp.]|uniref:Uncharacterized protein n=1 Tax=uncultured Segetibacter sp. TaxID=481133 RepID=A0A6J4TL78_9BACT|nr:MAG: hypothetical protein AVDCRST_MAG96-3189 [uncultured Segetibacter sp.]
MYNFLCYKLCPDHLTKNLFSAETFQEASFSSLNPGCNKGNKYGKDVRQEYG